MNWYKIHELLTDALLRLIKDEGIKDVGKSLVKLFVLHRETYSQEFSWFYRSYDIVQNKLKTNQWFTDAQIDPLQIFASINNKASRKENRVKRVRGLFHVLNIPFNFEDIDFEGCPTPVVVQGIQLKSEEDALLLWNYFEKVKSRDKINQDDFRSCLMVYGVEATLLSIFTFWVSPDKYIPLDKWTISYLVNVNKTLSFEESLLKSDLLFELINSNIEKHINNVDRIVTLVLKSYEWQIMDGLEKKGGFRLLAFGTSQSNSTRFKILKPDTLYILNQDLIVEGDKLLFNTSQFNMYVMADSSTLKVNGVDINISAIVGKNGSGKSTLIELLHLLLYNLSLQLGYIKKDRFRATLYPISDINFEVYFELDKVYKLVSNTDSNQVTKVQLFEGRVNEEGFLNFELLDQNRNIYKNIFYTVTVNYSFYSFNSNDYNELHSKKFDWLSSLTHKNDGYQTPVVITPLREYGNIDVNLERRLTKQRMLINYLQLHNTNIDNEQLLSIRSLDNKKIITHVKIDGESATILNYRSNLQLDATERKKSLSNLQIQYKGEKDADAKNVLLKNFLENLSENNINTLFDSIRVHYDLNEEIDTAYKLYLIVKLFKICWYYTDYNQYLRIFDGILKKGISGNNFTALVMDLDVNSSHISDKFKQVINYIKSIDLQNLYKIRVPIPLDTIDSEIEMILAKGLSSLQYPEKVIRNGITLEYKHLIIPPIFDYEYYYNNNIRADKLSSGEQQQLSSFGNILYHIRNLESRHHGKQDSVTYRYVNVVLDEIELYFHPEYQRTYIYKLVSYLTSPIFAINNIWGINILFSTHSPFILSDIPSQNILKLKAGEPAAKDEINSFAANIHDILKDEFFLEGGAMGEFAKVKINETIKFLNLETLLKERMMTDVADSKMIVAIEHRINDFISKELKFDLQSIDLSKMEEYKAEMRFQSPKFYFDLIQTIGEPILRNKLESMFLEIFPEDNKFKEELEFKRLAKKLNYEIVKK